MTEQTGSQHNAPQRLVSAWLENGVPGTSINAGATPDDVAGFERAQGVRVPTELRDYVMTADGIERGRADNALISFLSLSEIGDAMGQIGRRPDGLVDIPFAEFLIWSHYYVVRTRKDGTQAGVFVLDGTNEKLLAQSFFQWISLYCENPSDIANCFG